MINEMTMRRVRGALWQMIVAGAVLAPTLAGAEPPATQPPATQPAAALHPPIPIRFHLDAPAVVTLVVESADGVRVRNLSGEAELPAGDNVVWWDGLDDLSRDIDAAKHGLYQIPAHLVAPGEYRVRGLARGAIHLRYEFSVYNAGSPAWETADSRGAWLANHTPPSAVLFVPAADANQGPAAPCPGGVILAGSYVSEGGHGLAWLDLDGKKRYGQLWIGGVWTGASHLARDAGPTRAAGVYAYTAAAWEGGGFDGPKAELRLAELVTQAERSAAPRDGRFGKGWDRPLLKPNAPYQGILPGGKKATTAPADAGGADARYAFPDNKHVGVSGLAVHNGRLVASLPKMNQLLWVDAPRRKIIGTTDLADPRGVAFDSAGRLLALSGSRLLRFDVGDNPLALPAGKVLIADGLDDPQGLTTDEGGRIYVTNWGKSHQVKVYSPEGQLLRTVGAAGEPKAGPYDPAHMNHPKGITLDGRGRLWVAEEDYQPKRVSVWDEGGKLVAAYYGPSEYGGGGRLDPKDKTRFYYYGMEFKLDWERGSDQLTTVFFRPHEGDLPLPDGYGAGGMPEYAVYANGRQYMTNCYNSNPTNGSPIAMVWVMEGGRTRPVAGLGRANEWKVLKADAFKDRWPKGADPKGEFWRTQAMFVWCDTNGDAQAQPEEVTIWKANGGGITVLPDLSIVAARVDDRAVRYRPVRFTDAGVPVYDVEKGQTIMDGAQGPTSSGGDQALVSDDGWTILTVGPKPFAPQSMGGGKDGRASWSYPSLWPGLHASHESAAPDRPGMLIGTTRLLGGLVTPKAGEAGPLWCVNGNMGNMYLFTADGLLVAELFRDIRRGKSWTMPQATRGMILDDLSLHDENFWPTIAQTGDGGIYLVDGTRSSIVRIDGLESIRRLPAKGLTVSAEDLRSAQAWRLQEEAERQRSAGGGVLAVPIRRTEIIVDGKLDDWAGAQWVLVDGRGTRANFDSNSKPYSVQAAAAVCGDRLYAAFKTGDVNLLKNAGDTTAPFKTGGALDLMLGTDPKADRAAHRPVAGDLRLLVTRVSDKAGDKTGGKILAILYRPVVPGTKQPVPFSSPWRTITLDEVKDVSDQVLLAGADGNFELSIPLAVLGLRPEAGPTLRGDLGVLRGNGFQTLQRVYWHNKATGITSDVPSEAELTPWLWGVLKFQAGE